MSLRIVFLAFEFESHARERRVPTDRGGNGAEKPVRRSGILGKQKAKRNTPKTLVPCIKGCHPGSSCQCLSSIIE